MVPQLMWKRLLILEPMQNAKLVPMPCCAVDFQKLENSLILLLGLMDISNSDYLMTWTSHAFKVDTAEFCSNSSELVPRLDRWRASELIKGLKGVPDLQLKVPGYVERCTRNGTAPRGRAVLQMASRHFALDRIRGSLITSQSIFQVELNGYSMSDLQDFSSQVMKVLNIAFLMNNGRINSCLVNSFFAGSEQFGVLNM